MLLSRTVCPVGISIAEQGLGNRRAEHDHVGVTGDIGIRDKRPFTTLYECTSRERAANTRANSPKVRLLPLAIGPPRPISGDTAAQSGQLAGSRECGGISDGQRQRLRRLSARCPPPSGSRL